MQIAIDSSRAFVNQPTGTENYSYQLIKAIAKIDHHNHYTLYTRISSNSHCESRRAGRGNLNKIDSHTLPLAGFGMTKKRNANFLFKNISMSRLWTQVGLAKEMLIYPPDVLFIPAHTLPLIRRPGLKTVVTIHDLGYEYLPQYHQFPQKLYLNKSTEFAVWQSTHLIAVSEATKKDLINKLGCPKEKITVIYEGYDRKKFHPNSPNHPTCPPKPWRRGNHPKKLNLHQPFLLFVGTLQPRKNIERLIEAFSIVVHSLKLPNTPNLPNLVLAGASGWLYDEILTAPKRFGVEKQVKFLGYTKEDDLPALYSNCLAFCLPSLFEGFGLPVVEAMACGAPVIVSNSSSLPEIAGDAGLYVDPYDVNDIAAKLKLIIENGELRRTISALSLKQSQKFSWSKCAKETIGVLERVNNY